MVCYGQKSNLRPKLHQEPVILLRSRCSLLSMFISKRTSVIPFCLSFRTKSSLATYSNAITNDSRLSSSSVNPKLNQRLEPDLTPTLFQLWIDAYSKHSIETFSTVVVWFNELFFPGTRSMAAPKDIKWLNSNAKCGTCTGGRSYGPST